MYFLLGRVSREDSHQGSWLQGEPSIFLRHCQFDVGAYVEASTDAIITNDNSDRTRPCICLGPSGNRQGLYTCFSLDTGCVIVRRSAKQMPWLDRLLKIANSWGRRGKHAIQRGHLSLLN